MAGPFCDRQSVVWFYVGITIRLDQSGYSGNQS